MSTIATLTMVLLAACHKAPERPGVLRVGVVPFAQVGLPSSYHWLDDTITYSLLWRLGRLPWVQAKPVFLLQSAADSAAGRQLVQSLRQGTASDTALVRIALAADVDNLLYGVIELGSDATAVISFQAVSSSEKTVFLNRGEKAQIQDILELTAEVSRSFFRALHIALTTEEWNLLAQQPSSRIRAFSFYARAEMMRLRGGNAFDSGKYSEWINRAAELDMDFFDASRRLADLQIQSGNVRAAIAALTNATRIRPDWVEGYNKLATLLGEYRATDKVIEVSKKALNYDPENVAALANLGAAYLDRSQPDSALLYLNRALVKEPNNWRLIYDVGVVYVQKRQWQKGIHYLQKACTIRQDVPEIHYFLGVAYNNTGNPGEAVHWFRRALRLDPDGQYGRLARKQLQKILGYTPRGTD